MCEMGDQSNNDYLTTYRKFFEYFESSVDPSDQLPVKVAGYNVAEFEIPGEVADWALQYLNQRKCPPNLIAPIIRTLLDEINQKCKAQPDDCGYRPQNNDYQNLKLMQTATNQLIDVCKRYLNNAQLSTLPSPPSVILQAPPVSECGVKNARRTMEDRHIALQDLHELFNIKGYGPASYYAVFDGHNGSEAAVYCVSHLHQFLIESPHYPLDPITGLQDAFLKTDDYFKEKCAKEDLKSGTTVVCCLIRPKERMLYIAWAGDSQAVLVKNGVAKQIVNPHKPDRHDEKHRIEELGGSVLHWGVWRVNGQIAVSRAIGDQTCKPYVIAEPEIKAIPLDGSEEYIILGCDGLWDVVNEDQAMLAVYDYLLDSPGDLEGVSQRLVQLAKEKGSTDNISVVVVFLSEPSEVVKRRPMETANPPNPFHKQNGSELYCGGPQNGSLRCFQDDEEEDFGPETDVDAVDDVLMQPSSIAAAKALVSSSQNKDLEDDVERQRQQLSEFDDPADADRSTNTPTPPAGDVVGLPEAENVAESGGEGEDSEEEEWNYFKGEEKNTQSPTKEELEEMESRLNPDAPVFVPESPLKTAHSKIDDIDISSSPMKGFEKSLENVSLPTQNDFHKGIMECAGEFDRINGVDAHNKEPTDEKNIVINNHGDESEILSTKAEFGDDSAFSFSVSMNTSQAFSSELPNDEKESDLLFSSEKDFDPSMDSPKELQDLVSSPEPEENLIPGTPRSTVAEASVSPVNMDASPSHFMDFEKSDENVKDETAESSVSDHADSVSIERDFVPSDTNESPKPLTFAEVLKRPSPRTSPEPTVQSDFHHEVTNSLKNQCLEEETEAILKVDMSEFIPKLPDGFNEDDSPKHIIYDLPEELIVSDEFVKNNEDKIQSSNSTKNDGNDDGDSIVKLPDLDNLENYCQFVTVRKSPVDEHLVNFDELRTPDDETPPQFFQTDEVKNIPAVEAVPDDENPLFVKNAEDNFLDAAKTVSIEDDFPIFSPAESEVVNKMLPHSIQFLSSIHSEGDQIATEGDHITTEGDHIAKEIELGLKMDQANEINPGDLQFGTIDSKLDLNDGYDFSVGEINNVSESKDSIAVEYTIEGLKPEESHFELRTTKINENPLDFNESHFQEKTTEILTNSSIDTNFESKLDVQNVTTESHSPGSEFFHNVDASVPPVVSSPVTESVDLLGNMNVDDKRNPFDHEILSKNNDFSFENHDTLSHVLQNEISLSEKACFQESNNPFLEEINKSYEKSADESVLSQVESSSIFDSGLLLGNAEVHISESVIEQKNLDASLSAPLKQLEETLEQTINVDFIPAEPLGTLDAHLLSPTNVSKEESVISEGKEPTDIEEKVKLEESVTSDEVPLIPQASEHIEEPSKDLNLATGTPPPTPAPGVAEQKPEEKEGLLAAAAAAAVAGAAVTAGVTAAKTAAAKKSTTSVTAAKKPPSTIAPKKPTDLKTGTKTSSLTKTTVAPKPAGSPSKPAAPSTARKSLTSSSAPLSKPSAKPATTAGMKSSTTATSKSSPATKSISLTSKPSTPPSKPTTPTSASRPSSATKTSPTKPTVTARSTVPAAAKSKPSTVADKKPLMNGDAFKTAGKKPDSTLTAKKPLTSTAAKLSTTTTRPVASKTTTTSVTSKVGVSSTPKTNSVPATTASKLKTTTNVKPASTLNAAAKAKLPAKPTDKTVKETVNKQISSTASKVGTNKVLPSKTTTTSTTLKKTETKTSPGKTAVNKVSPVTKKTTSVIKKETKSEELTQDHIITTTNGFTEELIKNEVEMVKDSSPLDNICDDTLAATN